MKTQVIIILYAIILSFTLLVQSVAANQWFIKPSTEAPIRTGTGIEYRIVAIVKDGTAINILDRQNDWAKIRLANGREGWIPKRFLSNDKPLAKQLAELNLENKKLTEKIAQTDYNFQELIALNGKNEQYLSACINKRDNIKAKYEQLKIDTTDVVQTNEKLIASEQQLAKLQEELAILKKKNSDLENKSTLIWFLSGAGVLLSGLVIGLVSSKRTGKRRGSLR